jgi:hypothetical protein
MFPVFSLVLDKDVKSEVAMLYPELYKDLLKVCDGTLCGWMFGPLQSIVFYDFHGHGQHRLMVLLLTTFSEIIQKRSRDYVHASAKHSSEDCLSRNL